MSVEESPLHAAITQAMDELAQAILTSREGRAYQKTLQAIAADAEARALEADLAEAQARLANRQAQGENIPEAEAEQFYALRAAHRGHPLFQAREAALQIMKPLLSEAVQNMNLQMGLDFVALSE